MELPKNKRIRAHVYISISSPHFHQLSVYKAEVLKSFCTRKFSGFEVKILNRLFSTGDSLAENQKDKRIGAIRRFPYERVAFSEKKLIEQIDNWFEKSERTKTVTNEKTKKVVQQYREEADRMEKNLMFENEKIENIYKNVGRFISTVESSRYKN